MSDLTDEELGLLDVVGAQLERRAVAEIRRHRALVKRLEEWAVQLDDKPNDPGHVGHFIAAELRNRMRTP